MKEQKDFQKLSVVAHKKARGKLSVEPTMPIRTKDELSIAYTPGVAGPCKAIAEKKVAVRDVSTAKNTVAIVSDGTAVLGLGNIGPEAALPVMEGKAALLKRFAGINGFPIVLGTTDTEEIIQTIKNIAPTFGAINLEDISAPRCFEIEERLTKELSIPVMHDDQHGTAIVVLAGLINALTVARKKHAHARVVIIGAGAAGIATARLLSAYGVRHIALVDSKGVVAKNRPDLSGVKRQMAQETNPWVTGSLEEILESADVCIGVSKGDMLTPKMIQSMAEKPIIFAMANPIPEIMPDAALEAGVYIIATGRSDFPNQINNSLAFPGIYKGLIESGATRITQEMKLRAAKALAHMVKKPGRKCIIPGPFEPKIAEIVARAIRKEAK